MSWRSSFSFAAAGLQRQMKVMFEVEVGHQTIARTYTESKKDARAC
jgi:hypothetical protein